jgi:myo-inositol-1(or 4)-monophosphatase
MGTEMPKNPDWNDLTDFALALAAAAGSAILPYFRQNTAIEAKPHHSWDPVTEGDKAGERAIRQMIEERYPDHGIHGEEYGRKEARSPYTWVLDPIDGTRAFICGMPTWTTLIGLTCEGRPRLGIMSQPFVQEIFLGTPEGAWNLHGRKRTPLRVRACAGLGDATAGTTAPEQYRSAEDQAGFRRLSSAVKMMRYGGDAYFYSLLAAGQLDIAMDAGLQAYDIAALIPIVEGAGGIVGSWSGSDVSQGGDILCAASPALFEEAVSVMKAGAGA